jgi:hypothetical protein
MTEIHRKEPPVNADESREQVALRRCDEQIRWYDRYSKREWRLFTLFQSAAIALAAATPVSYGEASTDDVVLEEV